MRLVAINDSRDTLTVSYTIKNLLDDRLISKGNFTITPDGKLDIENIRHIDHAFFLIEWETNNVKDSNHHACSLGDKWNYNNYINCMKKAGFYNEFEGF